MSQEELADKADLHFTFIGKIERAEINPSIISLEKIAMAFTIPISQLLSFPDDKKVVEAKVKLLTESLDKANKELKVASDIVKDFRDTS